MFSSLALGVVLLLAGKDPQVVGSWGMGGAQIMQINADGTGEMEGEPFTWSTDKGVITITSDGETEKLGYSVKGGKLAIAMDGMPMTFDKLGGGGSGAATAAGPAKGGKGAKAQPVEGMEGLSPEEVAMLQQMMAQQGGNGAAVAPVGNANAAGAKAAAPAKGKPAGKDQLSQLLLSTAWCSFSYSGGSTYAMSYGTTSKSRVQFFQNGTYTMSSGSESSNSGPNGQYYGAGNGGTTGNWETRANGQQLWMSSQETNGQLVQLPGLKVEKNSSGYPIITANGKEYMMCQ